ncbi:hypothetical protein [Lacibacter sp. H407]|uniref:hypothetical protein n=1 Tax=Lacibacter sp. H407 TaxID=3133423 RepID=UPI0030C472F3
MTRRQTLRLIFHKDTIALLASLVFLWFTIGLLDDINYRFEDLTKHSGQLVKIDSVITRVKDKPLFKEITKELRLTIDTDNKYFTSITTKDFGYITGNVSIGDTVHIFTKKKLWGIFGMKKARDISHLAKGDIVIVDFEKYQQSLSGVFLVTLVAAIGFFIYYFVRTKRRYYFDMHSKL